MLGIKGIVVLNMQKVHIFTATVIVAIVLNISLVAFFVWLAFSPPAFYGIPSDKDLTYLIFATYSLINFIVLLFRAERKGVLYVIRRLVFGFNLLLIAGAIVFGVASAVENNYSRPEIFVTLWLLIPPLVTAAGFKCQQSVSANMPNNALK